MARNSRDNWLTRLQEWDYELGIASIKRSQAIWQATLVSQGAFSVYKRQAVVEAGGWPDAIGEDIVLTAEGDGADEALDTLVALLSRDLDAE